jgi:hypothetical protein
MGVQKYSTSPRTKEKSKVEEFILDSDSHLRVRIVEEGGEISKALVESIGQELKEFYAKFQLPLEPNYRQLKGTLLLRLNVNTEDFSDISAKLLRLCDTKIKGNLVDYYVNVKLYIKPRGKAIGSKHMSAGETDFNKMPKKIHLEKDLHKLYLLQELEREKESLCSKSEVHCGLNDLGIGNSNDNNGTRIPDEKEENPFKDIADSTSSICGSNLEVKSEKLSTDICVPNKPEKPEASNSKTGGGTSGVDADALMSRLCRVIKSSENSSGTLTEEDKENIKFLAKSFKCTGIVDSARAEISSLNSSDMLWIRETMQDIKYSVALICILHLWEFHALCSKFPDLATFYDFVHSKEKQWMQPSVRRKYISLILFCALGSSLKRKFPDFAKEIEEFKDLRDHMRLLLVLKLQKKCAAKNEKMSSLSITEIFDENESEATVTQHTSDVVVDPKACNAGNDCQSEPDTEEKSRNKSDEEPPKSSDSRADVANLRDVKHAGNKGNTYTTTAKPTKRGTAYTYEESWAFEKDSISSLDDRIRTKRYGKGAKNRFEEPKVKLKTRGIPNRHIRPLKQDILVEDAQELSSSKIIHEIFCSLSNNSAASCGDFDSTYKEQILDKPCVGSGEIESDSRHFECAPSAIIMGKKNEIEDLGIRYGAIENYAKAASKNRKQQKKLQRRGNRGFHQENQNNSALTDSDSDDLMEDSDSSGESDDSSLDLAFVIEILNKDLIQ